MIEKGKTYIVMGLLDSDSIAYAIGKTIEQHGGQVIFTVQNERMKKIFFDRSKKMTDEEKGAVNIQYCDVTVEEDLKRFFSAQGEIKPASCTPSPSPIPPPVSAPNFTPTPSKTSSRPSTSAASPWPPWCAMAIPT